jgi:hypothetical protein
MTEGEHIDIVRHYFSMAVFGKIWVLADYFEILRERARKDVDKTKLNK